MKAIRIKNDWERAMEHELEFVKFQFGVGLGFLIVLLAISIYSIYKVGEAAIGAICLIIMPIMLFPIFMLRSINKWKKYIIAHYTAKYFILYDDRVEYVSATGQKHVVFFEEIAAIWCPRKIETRPCYKITWGLIFYYDRNMRKCNTVYGEREVVEKILEVYREWLRRTGRKPCMIAEGVVRDTTVLRRVGWIKSDKKHPFCNRDRRKRRWS